MIPSQEYIRKFIHLSNMIIPISYLFLFDQKIYLIYILFFLSILFVVIDLCRNRFFVLRKFFKYFFNDMMRKHELNGDLTGASWVMIASFLTVLLFPKYIAILALIFMSIGDTVAGLIGQRFGKFNIGKKTWEGFFAGLFACLVVTYFYNYLPLSISIVGAIIAMIFEIIPIGIDDNLKIPISSASVMLAMQSL